MRRLLLLVLLLAAPALRAAPEASPELAALVPAETLLLAEGNDLDGACRFGPGTAIGQLLAEPDVQLFARKLEESMKAASGSARGPLSMLGLTPEDFDGIRVRRAGFALVGASVGTHQVDAVLYLETRAGGEKVERILKGLRQAAEAYLAVQFTESDVRGRKVLSTSVLGHEICIAVQGERVVVTTQRARMDDVLKAIDEGHPTPLRAAPRMARLRERMGAGRNALLCYVDAPAIARIALDVWTREDPEHAAVAQRIGTALGLDAVEALGFADVPEGTGYRTEGAILLKERRGLFSLAPSAPPSHRFAKMTPADALAYGGETCDLAALWDGILALAGAVGPDHRAKFEQGEAKANAMLGLDLRKDLLAAFGTEWAGYVAWPSGGGLLPDVVLFASVRDRERLARALDTLSAKANDAVRERGASVTACKTEFRGKEIRFLEVVDRRGEPRPYAPAWAFGDDFVVFGLCPQTVKNALMEKPALAARADFQQLLSAAPRTSVSATYFDLGRVVTCLYATAVPVLQVAQGAANRKLAMVGVRLNFEDLPPADVIARHLSGVLCYTAVEDDCVRMGCLSQFGAPLVVAPVAALAGAAAALFAMRKKEAEHMERMAAERLGKAQEEVARAGINELARAQEVEKLRAENEMLRERLAKIEEQVAELRRLVEEKK